MHTTTRDVKQKNLAKIAGGAVTFADRHGRVGWYVACIMLLDLVVRFIPGLQ